MEKFCPLCMQKGIKNKIKAFQINLEEAVWSCENPDCVWPFGYENLTFFPRSAFSCDWEQSYPDKESIPMLTDLSLYTPPMTPRGESLECSVNSTVEDKLSELFPKNESINFNRENTDCNDPLLVLTSNKCTKEKDRWPDKAMPKIINIEKVNININTILQDRHLTDERLQQHSSVISTMDTEEDCGILFDETGYNQFIPQVQCKTEKEQSESYTLQTDEVANYLDTNANLDILLSATNSEVNMGIMNNSNIGNLTLDTTNTNDSNIDTILDDLINNTSDIETNIDEDWLDFIQI